MMWQFQSGSFYGWFKLKEIDIQNLVWIDECIGQGMKTKVQPPVQCFVRQGGARCFT